MTDNPGPRIDIAHAKLIEGLVCAHKPTNVLEFGFGGGRSAEAILRGLEFNGTPFRYLLVDNWADWGGQIPQEADTFAHQHPEVQVVTEDEGRFATQPAGHYDFIMSDADHVHTHEWFRRVYNDILNPGGVLIYHDVRGDSFPGLQSIVEQCVQQKVRHVVFDKNSRDGEQCDRGLLVIFKESQ